MGFCDGVYPGNALVEFTALPMAPQPSKTHSKSTKSRKELSQRLSKLSSEIPPLREEIKALKKTVSKNSKIASKNTCEAKKFLEEESQKNTTIIVKTTFGAVATVATLSIGASVGLPALIESGPQILSAGQGIINTSNAAYTIYRRLNDESLPGSTAKEIDLGVQAASIAMGAVQIVSAVGGFPVPDQLLELSAGALSIAGSVSANTADDNWTPESGLHLAGDALSLASEL